MRSIKSLRTFALVAAVLTLYTPALRAGSSARQNITFSVEAITVLAVKQGGSGSGGIDLGNSSYICISDQGVTVNGNRLVWTANVRAKVTVESASTSDNLLVRATNIQGRGRPNGWVSVRSGSVVVSGIDREAGGCSLEYMLAKLPEAAATVVATYTITAD